MTPITVHLPQRGERTNELLSALAARLHLDRLAPDANGLVHVVVELDSGPAWDLVVSTLDDIAEDWRDFLSIGQRRGR
jgi:hypothetical protein